MADVNTTVAMSVAATDPAVAAFYPLIPSSNLVLMCFAENKDFGALFPLKELTS